MSRRTPDELAAHHEALAALHARRAKIAASDRLTALESIRRKLEALGETTLEDHVSNAINEDIAGVPEMDREYRSLPEFTLDDDKE